MSLTRCINKGLLLAAGFILCSAGYTAPAQDQPAGKTPAKITLSGLNQIYSGKQKRVRATTDPAGLAVILTYDGSETVPAKAGTYTVTGTIKHAKYEGSATATLTIAKAPQKIIFNALAARTYGERPFALLSSSVASGLAAVYESSNPAVAAVSGNMVTIMEAGTAVITAYQAGDENNMPAEPVRQSLTVKKAKAKITLANLEQTYNGEPKPIKAATRPEGLDMSIAYDGKAEAPVNAGRYKVTVAVQNANYEGDAAATLVIAKAPQSITFNAPATRTYGDASFSLAAAVSSGLTVTYKISNAAVATISGSEVTIAGTGTAGITAYQAGNGNYLPAKPVRQALTVAKAPQSMTFNALAARTYGDADFSPEAAAGSGLPASYSSSNPSVATVVKNQIHIVGAGSSTITASQAGDENHLPAEPVRQVLTVNKAKATVTITGLEQTYDGTIKQARASTVPEGLDVALTYDKKAEAPVQAGAYPVAAEVRDANYEGSAAATLTIAKAPQSVTFNALAARTYGDAPFALSATVSSGLTATYGSSNPAVAAISGSSVTIAGAGTAEITAYQAGDENHLPVQPIKQVLSVAKAGQSITFAALAALTYGDTDFSPAIVSSGLPVSYTSSNPSVATVVENHIRIVGAGSSTITASNPGDNNYLPAKPVQQTLTVNKAKAKVTLTVLNRNYDGTVKPALVATQPAGLNVTLTYGGKAEPPAQAGAYLVAATVQDANYEGSASTTLTVTKASQRLVFEPLPIQTFGDRPITLYSAASSGLTATYASSNPAVATISGNTVKITGAGTTEITAYQAGDTNYQAAEPSKQLLVVRGIPHRIAVLPLVNLSGQPAPEKEMRQELIDRFVAAGAEVLDSEGLEKFMARHRVRNVDGIDGATARALRQETGMEAVVITTLERYVDTDSPSIAMTSRLVSAEETPIILWMETVSLWGGDAPGLLGLGLIKDIKKLQKKALDHLTGSLKKFLAGTTSAGIAQGERVAQPKTMYSAPFMRPGRKYSIAVAPFLNASKRNNADTFLALHFMCQLTKEGAFNVIDPGSVRDKLLSFRLILQEGLSMRQADLIHDSLQVDLILAGKVVEYEETEGSPKVEFSSLVFERRKKKVVWESLSSNRGNDDVTFFAWGRVSTAEELASNMTQAAVRDLSVQGTYPPGQVPAVRPFRKGPWSLD